MRVRRALILVLVVWLAATGRVVEAGAPATKSHPKRDLRLQTAVSDGTRVIIRTRPGAVAAVAERIRDRHHPVGADFPFINALTASVDEAELAALDADEAVENVSLDAVVTDSATATVDVSSDDTLLSAIGLPGGLTGKGVGVAVIDSGINPASADFGAVRSFDFTTATATPVDAYGHGTHVSGLIAGRGNTSVKTATGRLYQGVAPGAALISLRVLDANGAGLTSTVIAAIQFVIQNKQSLGIDIINLSLGHPIYEPAGQDPLVRAVEAAARAGIVVVVAAGNVGRSPATGVVGYAGILSPGNAPSAVTVGALDTAKTTTRLDDFVAPYSSRGPTWQDGLAKPDLVAPGQDLVASSAPGSTLFESYPDGRVSTTGGPAKFFRLSGTSMAAAVTSGVAALVIEANRSAFATRLTPNLVKAILEFTALPLSGVDTLTQGRGAVNAAGATALAARLNPAVPPGPWWAGLPITPSTTIGSETWAWSQSILWGNTVVWGMSDWSDTVVWGMDGGDTVVWGMSGDGDTVVWGMDGDTVVWGMTDGDTVVWGMTGDGDTVVWGMTNVVWSDPSFWTGALVWIEPQ